MESRLKNNSQKNKKYLNSPQRSNQNRKLQSKKTPNRKPQLKREKMRHLPKNRNQKRHQSLMPKKMLSQLLRLNQRSSPLNLLQKCKPKNQNQLLLKALL